jgi:hypothetical protein
MQRMASDLTKFLEQFLKNQEKQPLRAQRAARKTEQILSKMMSMMCNFSKSQPNSQHKNKKSSTKKPSKRDYGNQFPIVIPSDHQDVNALHQTNNFPRKDAPAMIAKKASRSRSSKNQPSERMSTTGLLPNDEPLERTNYNALYQYEIAKVTHNKSQELTPLTTTTATSPPKVTTQTNSQRFSFLPVKMLPNPPVANSQKATLPKPS